MKQKRHTTEQIIHKLREADALLASGATVADACKQIGVSEGTYQRWRALYRGLEPNAVRRLRSLEKENARLKKIVADQAVDISILKEVARGEF
jgi:transposase-like protein